MVYATWVRSVDAKRVVAISGQNLLAGEDRASHLVDDEPVAAVASVGADGNGARVPGGATAEDAAGDIGQDEQDGAAGGPVGVMPGVATGDVHGWPRRRRRWRGAVVSRRCHGLVDLRMCGGCHVSGLLRVVGPAGR
jgi:hypothetical protein